jgi:hypothetical protein
VGSNLIPFTERSFDALAARFRELRFPRRPDCPACGDAATETPGPVAAGPVPAGLWQATPSSDESPRERRGATRMACASSPAHDP